MRTIILDTTVKLLMPLFFIFSVFLLFRGHNLPGGGFIGGLLASIALFLHSMVFGVEATLKRYNLNSRKLIASGLLVSLTSVVISLTMGLTLFTGVWSSFQLPLIGNLGTPMLFDIGVYLVVVGVVLNITFVLTEN